MKSLVKRWRSGDYGRTVTTMWKQKAFILTFAAALILLCVAGCSTDDVEIPQNTIKLSDLNADQQDIVDLMTIPNAQEVLIFDFNTEEAFNNVEFWVEIHRNGKLSDQPARVMTILDKTDSQSGRLAVVITQKPNYRWMLSVVTGGTRSSHASTAEVEVDSALARATGITEEAVTIEDGKEIILYTALFTTGGLTVYDHKTIQERPELLSEYTFAHVIKCKFTK